jgi:hypothetical protein
MTQARDKAKAYLKGRGIEKMDFSHYWKRGAKVLAESLVKWPEVLEACRVRGIDGLLDQRSVRLCVGANISLVYAQDFKGRQPEAKRAMGDAWDMLHAVSASAADIFVTHDRAFTDVMKRVPINDFEVLGLHGLLDII